MQLGFLLQPRDYHFHFNLSDTKLSIVMFVDDRV